MLKPTKTNHELKECYKVRRTSDYSLFKMLEGNRDINHAEKVGKSIDTIGLLPIPIIVNEMMEIFDGQGRFEACVKRNLPIYYMIIANLRMNDVRNLNSCSTIWKSDDYVKSFAIGEDRKESYIYLQALRNRYPQFSYKILCMATVNAYGEHQIRRDIKNGDFECDESGYNQALNILDWLSQFTEYIDKIPGKSDYMNCALAYAYGNESVDNDYLLEKFKKRYASVPEIASVRGSIESIEKLYNYRIDKVHEEIYIISEFEREVRKQQGKNKRRRKCN